MLLFSTSKNMRAQQDYLPLSPSRWCQRIVCITAFVFLVFLYIFYLNKRGIGFSRRLCHIPTWLMNDTQVQILV